jgi:hypothetical protein
MGDRRPVLRGSRRMGDMVDEAAAVSDPVLDQALAIMGAG